ncbi:proteasome assembly chaperone family protein [Thermoproteota archaeon]
MSLKIIPENVDFKGLSLITGFHGIGAAGYWTVKYLIKQLDAKRAAIIDTKNPTPMASNDGGNLVTPFEFFKKDNLIFFKVEAPLYKDEDMIFFKNLADYIVDSGFKEAALIGGLDSRLKIDNSTFRLVKTSAYKLEKKLSKSIFLEDGQIIVGPVAVMLNRFEARNFPAYSILSYASAEHIDPRSASAAIDTLSDLYGFEIDTKPLVKDANVIESAIEKSSELIGQNGNTIYT